MNTVLASFSTTMVQTTEMSQQKNKSPLNTGTKASFKMK